jgi:hypothetical protein
MSFDLIRNFLRENALKFVAQEGEKRRPVSIAGGASGGENPHFLQENKKVKEGHLFVVVQCASIELQL